MNLQVKLGRATATWTTWATCVALAGTAWMRLAGQGLPNAIAVQWTAPYHSEMTGTEPVWFGRDGSALLGQVGRTNWLWVASDGRRATLSDPYFGDMMQNWGIVYLTSRAFLTEVRTGGMMSTNSDWRLYRRGEDGAVTVSILKVGGTAYPPTSGTTAILSGRSVTRAVSRLPPDGWFASEVDTGSGQTGTVPNRMLTLFKVDGSALETGTARPVLAMERGQPMQLRIELASAAPVVVQTSEDLNQWLPWAVLLEPGASVFLPVTDTGKPKRFFAVQQLDGATGRGNPSE